jgi:putative peptidoglycan lipid II flippase
LTGVRNAALVAAGILLSRAAGLVRLRVFAHYFGLQSDAGDAFNAAFRIPNFLQNLFGEGALSASFIPVYAGLIAREDRQAAERVARAVGGLLALAVAAIVLVGISAAPFLTSAIAPGFHGAKRDLTIALVRILFPGAGLLVMSAWCLGILNSHGRFLLSYAAPVTWNAAMIATLVAFGPRESLPQLATWLAWGSVVGSALQVIVQLPAVVRILPEFRMRSPQADARGVRDHVRVVLRNFVPAFMGRGAVQLSAFVDSLLASLLPTGAMTGLANAQLIYTLPVSLFGMSVAAAELPSMAGEAAVADVSGRSPVAVRIALALRRVAFLAVPSATALLFFGDMVAGALLQTGRFGRSDSIYVWGLLAGASIGLLPSTLGRVYSSGYYALHDTRTPLRYALLRVATSSAAGYVLALPVPRALGLPPMWGAAGITFASGLAGCVEMALLRRGLARRVGPIGLPRALLARLWGAALVAAGVGTAVRIVLPAMHPVLAAAGILGPFGLVYLGLAAALGVAEIHALGEQLRSATNRGADSRSRNA